MVRPRLLRLAFLGTGMLAVCAGVALAAEIRDLPVPVATIYPDTIITARDLRLRAFKTSSGSLDGIATAVPDIAGKMARRRLVAGKPIPVSALGDPDTVRKGDQVLALFSEGGLSISVILLALDNGGTGETVRVRNTSTGVMVKAVVQADGSVRVGE